MADAAQPRELPAKRIIAFVFTTVFLNMVGFGLIIPIMPTLMVDVTGAGISNAARYTGILYVVFALGQFIFSPILGGLSDRYGRRPVLLVSLTFYALDFLLLAVAPTFAWLVVARVLSGVTSATYATANAVIADVLPPKERAGTFGLTGAAFGLGFIIGPVIGGSLAEFGVRTPFYVGAALGGINVLFGLIAMPETLKTKRAFSWRRANPLGSIYAASRHAGVVLVLISMFLVQFAYQTLPSVFAFFATLTFGWTPLHISYALAFVGLTSATVQVGLVRRVTAKIGEARAAIVGIFGMTISFLGYAFMSPSGIYIYFWVAVGAVGGFIMPAMQAILSSSVPADSQGELQGAVASVMSLTMLTSPVTMTTIFSAYTDDVGLYMPGAPLVLGCLCVALSMVPFLIIVRRQGRPTAQASAGVSA